MSMMMTRTTSLEDQLVYSTKLIKGLSTSPKVKDHEIVKLMNKLESMNYRGQTLATKVVQVDQLDVVEDSIIGATRNIHNITDGIFPTNQLKKLIK
jgi:hypothetical protein